MSGSFLVSLAWQVWGSPIHYIKYQAAASSEFATACDNRGQLEEKPALFSPSGEGHGKAAALAGCADGFDAAMMRLDNRFRDGQPDA